jgi:mRNA-degrading endonuclease toxin of MazEF toxin-antitoxin module
MVDRIQTSTLSRIGGLVGQIDARTMTLVERALMVHLGLV